MIKAGLKIREGWSNRLIAKGGCVGFIVFHGIVLDTLTTIKYKPITPKRTFASSESMPERDLIGFPDVSVFAEGVGTAREILQMKEGNRPYE